MRILDERLDALVNDEWESDYLSRESVSYESISWDFGNLVQRLSFLQRLHLQVPEDIRQTIPRDAKPEVVKAYRENARYFTTVDVTEILDEWEEST
jgi:hypothetical protein